MVRAAQEKEAMLAEACGVIVFVTLIYITLQFVDHLLKLRRFPPGPFPLPVIGNLHMMGTKPYEMFRDMAKKYGNVFSLSLGMERVVIINSIQPAREALITKGTDFAGRPTHGYAMDLLSRGFKDIAFTDFSPLWTFQRKLGHAALKMYAEGMGSLEEEIVLESDDLHNRMIKANGEPLDVHLEFGCSVLNVICSMIFGSRYDHHDPEFVEVIRWCNLVTEGFSNGDPASFLPWLLWVHRFFPLPGLKKLEESVKLRDPFLRRKLNEHKQAFDPDHIRDFTDSLIKSSLDPEFQEHFLNDDGKNEIDDRLEMILFDLFVAGAETTATTLRWLVLYLLHWPHIQDEVFEEIKKQTDENGKRYPGVVDRSKLPLCQATIQETLRFSSLVPLGAPHKAIRNTSVGGLDIPTDTQVLFNLWNIHNDPCQWENPETFNPHRWLDERGDYIPGRHISFLPFGAGRRGCLGEAMAKTELFLFFTRFMRDFKVEPCTNGSLPSLQGRIGVTLAPIPYLVVIKPRK